MKKNRYCFCILIMIFLLSCQKGSKDLKNPEEYMVYTYSQIFESFWQGMNSYYVFWDTDKDKVDWDAAYMKYKPLFNQLDVKDDEDLLTGVDYIKEMTRYFKDGHFTITFNSSRLAGYAIKPAGEQKNLKDFDTYVTEDQQWNKNPELYMDAPFYKATNGSMLLSGTINDSVLYFCIKNFNLRKDCIDNPKAEIKNVFSYFLNTLKEDKIKKVIIDFRGNEGGDVADLNFLVGQFISSPLKFGKLQYKSTPNRFDYTPLIDAVVQPQSSDFSFIKPIRILTDGRSASMAEICAMAFRTIKNTRIVGDTTWGATGLLPESYNSQLFNGGPFAAGALINVSASAARFYYIDGRSYEGVGFPPDIRQLNIKGSGRDEQLERAIKE